VPQKKRRAFPVAFIPKNNFKNYTKTPDLTKSTRSCHGNTEEEEPLSCDTINQILKKQTENTERKSEDLQVLRMFTRD